MADLGTPDKIEAWISRYDGTKDEAVEQLRKITIVPGQLRHRDQVRAWLAEQERLGQVQKDTAEHDFMRRQTVAAETSAEAAKQSATWAKLSAFIALAALVATAWPYFKLIDALSRLLAR